MQSIDVLRGLYVRSPHWLRRRLATILAMVPVRLRFGGTYRHLRAEIKRSQVEARFVETYQIQKLRDLIKTCAKSSPYYRAVFQQVFGGTPDPAKFTFDNFRKLPILNKEEIRKATKQLLVKNVNEVDEATTSGSSGEPLKFYLDRDRSVKEWAFIHHLWQRIGYYPYHRRAVLRGIFIPNVDVKPWEYDPALGELRLSPFHLIPEIMDTYLHLIDAYKINFIHGYPSAITILANHALRIKWKPPTSLIGILPVSESLLPYQRHLMQKAFDNVKVMTFYGLSEKVAIAGELPDEPDVYEFEPLYGITELVDDQGVMITSPGVIGRIVATGFLSSAMPLLRYDTGDTAELVRLSGQDNCYRLRVRRICSRWAQEFVVGSNGALISMTAINIHSPIYSRIQAFQFYQNTPGEVTVRVIPLPGMREEAIKPFVEEIQAKVGQCVRFGLELTEALAMNSRGKRRFIDQRLNLVNGVKTTA